MSLPAAMTKCATGSDCYTMTKIFRSLSETFGMLTSRNIEKSDYLQTDRQTHIETLMFIGPCIIAIVEE